MKIGRWRCPVGKNAGFRSGKPCTLSCAAATTSTWIRLDSFLCWKRFFRRMKELYNGYRFHPKAVKSVCHTSMCMEFLRFIRDHGEEPGGADILDSSVAVDLSKIHGILSLGNTVFVRSVVERCLKGLPVPYVSLSKTINLNQQDGLDDKDVLTTLVFMGYLTFAPGPEKALVCPNKTILEQFFGYYFKYLSGLG